MSENAFTFYIRLINRSPGASQLAFSPARGRLGTGATLMEELSQWFQTKGGLFRKNQSSWEQEQFQAFFVIRWQHSDR